MTISAKNDVKQSKKIFFKSMTLETFFFIEHEKLRRIYNDVSLEKSAWTFRSNSIFFFTWSLLWLRIWHKEYWVIYWGLIELKLQEKFEKYKKGAYRNKWSNCRTPISISHGTSVNLLQCHKLLSSWAVGSYQCC